MVGGSDNNVRAGSVDQSNTHGKIIPLRVFGFGRARDDSDYFQKCFWSISSICVSQHERVTDVDRRPAALTDPVRLRATRPNERMVRKLLS